MKTKMKILFHLVGSLFMMYQAESVTAAPVNEIQEHGIYVVAEKGYVKVEPYSEYDEFVDFKRLNTIPFVIRGSDSLKLIVYEKHFSERSIMLKLRPIDVVVNIQDLKFKVKPLTKRDMYEISIATPIKNGVMLHVYSSFFDYMGVIMLGDTQDELVKYFSQKQLKKPGTVIQYLEDALVAFPENSKLKELTDFWKKAAEAEKEKQAYSYVEEKWQQYEQAEKLTLKQRYLEAVIVEIEGYLREHPNGAMAKEAKKRKKIAEEKLKEYEKSL